MKLPRIAILMATHNDGELLHEAVASIVNGTCAVDLFIVDDCSQVPAAITPAHPRVHLLRLNENVGLTRALNHGLARLLPLGYDYVGRMDADDISHPERIARQVAHLEANPQLAGVGCWANFIDAESGEHVFLYAPPSAPESIRRALFSNSCVLHPAWLMRAEVFRELQGYDEAFPVAQDYEFLMRATARGFDFANVPTVLLDYRISPNGISMKRRRRQLWSRLVVQTRHFRIAYPMSWWGIAKTALLFAVPVELLRRIKAARSAAMGAAG